MSASVIPEHRLPSGWSERRLGTLGRFGKGYGGTKEDNRDSGVPVVRYGDLYSAFDTVITTPVAYVSEETATRYAPLQAGTLVLTASGEDPTEIGKAALSELPSPAVVGGDAILFRPGSDADGLYLAYALQSSPAVAQKTGLSTGFTVVHITAGRLKTVRVALPSLAEQRAIANYLDRETAKIDALVAKQNEMIETLRERRAGIILGGVSGAGQSHRSVSLGWLESLPPHWGDIKVGRIGDVTLGKMVTPAQSEAAPIRAPYLRAANVQPDGVTAFDNLKEMWFNERELRFQSLRSGDVIVVEGGQGGFGRAALLQADLPGVGFQNSIIRIRPRRMSGSFLTYCLIAARASDYIRAFCDVVSMPHFTAEKVSRLRVPFPPPEEQRKIADYLDRETAKIDTLIAKVERHIELAKERRSALITAAVTGQIDVTKDAA